MYIVHVLPHTHIHTHTHTHTPLYLSLVLLFTFGREVKTESLLDNFLVGVLLCEVVGEPNPPTDFSELVLELTGSSEGCEGVGL